MSGRETDSGCWRVEGGKRIALVGWVLQTPLQPELTFHDVPRDFQGVAPFAIRPPVTQLTLCRRSSLNHLVGEIF